MAKKAVRFERLQVKHGDDWQNKAWRKRHLRDKSNAAIDFTLVRIATNLVSIARYWTMSLVVARIGGMDEGL
jgi:hypothetical protein